MKKTISLIMIICFSALTTSCENYQKIVKQHKVDLLLLKDQCEGFLKEYKEIYKPKKKKERNIFKDKYNQFAPVFNNLIYFLETSLDGTYSEKDFQKNYETKITDVNQSALDLCNTLQSYKGVGCSCNLRKDAGVKPTTCKDAPKKGEVEIKGVTAVVAIVAAIIPVVKAGYELYKEARDNYKKEQKDKVTALQADLDKLIMSDYDGKKLVSKSVNKFETKTTEKPKKKSAKV